MKEFNKPADEIVEEKQQAKRERPYFEMDESELNFLAETYRKILRVEPSNELKTLLKSAIENLERELRLRSKLKTAKS